MKLKKCLALASSLAVLSSGFSVLPTFAQDTDDSITISIVTDADYVERSDFTDYRTKDGVSVYIKGLKGQKVSKATVSLKCDDPEIFFSDIAEPNEVNSEEEYNYFGNNVFLTNLTPFCFGDFSKQSEGKAKYSAGNYIYMTNKYLLDPVFNKPFYYGGSLGGAFSGFTGVYLKVNNYSENGENVAEKIFATDTLKYKGASTLHVRGADPNGIDVKYRFENSIRDPENGEVLTYKDSKIVNLKHYEPYAEEGQKVQDDCNKVEYADPAGGKVFNEDYPFMKTKAVIPKGYKGEHFYITPDVANTFVITDSGKKYSYELGNLKIKYAQIKTCDKIVFDDYEINPLYLKSDSKEPITAKAAFKTAYATIYNHGNKSKVDIHDKIYIGGDEDNSIYQNYVFAPDIFLEGFGMTSYDFTVCYGGKPLKDETGEIVIDKDVYIGLKGDANLDGEVNATDATAVLIQFAQSLAVGNTSPLLSEHSPKIDNLAYMLADIDTESKDHGVTGGVLNSEDATAILIYFANKQVNDKFTWDEVTK